MPASHQATEPPASLLAMKQYYRRSNLKNRLILAAVILAAIFLISIYYKSPETSFIQYFKRGAISVVAYVQMGAKKVLSPVYDGWIYLLDLSSARSQNMIMKKELSRLNEGLTELKVIQEENERLRKIVGLPARKKFKYIMAYPVSTSSNNWEASIIIDKGSVHGVKNRMPVYTSDGLVGQVVNVSPLASQVQLIIDNKSGVAAEIVGRNLKGLVQGTFENKLEMTLVNKTAKVEEGDSVITSGLGGVYPKGLFVGKIITAKSPAQALYKEIKMESSVDFNNLNEVLVITSPLPPDIDELR